MAQRMVEFAEGEYFHIYNRGINKMKIFNSPIDQDRFVNLLFFVNSEKKNKFSDFGKKNLWDFDRGETLVDIGAYTLMPNHFHLLIRANKKEKGVTNFMHRLETAYSKYFNLKNDRVGSLFESKFKAEHVKEDKYLKYLFSYIHLNPIKLIEPSWKEAGIKDFEKAKSHLEKYQFSSYLDHKNKQRPQNKIINKSVFPEYFVSVEDFDKEVNNWLRYEKI